MSALGDFAVKIITLVGNVVYITGFTSYNAARNRADLAICEGMSACVMPM